MKICASLEDIQTQLGENSCGGTPRSIPNLEVKPVNAESTWGAALWEDRKFLSTIIISHFYFYVNIFYLSFSFVLSTTSFILLII